MTTTKDDTTGSKLTISYPRGHYIKGSVRKVRTLSGSGKGEGERRKKKKTTKPTSEQQEEKSDIKKVCTAIQMMHAATCQTVKCVLLYR